MRGRGLGAGRGAGERILDVAATDACRRLGERRVDPGIDRLLRHVRPFDLGAAVAEGDAPACVVVGYHEEGMKRLQRPVIDAPDQALRGAEQPTAGDEEDRQQRRERRWHHPFLDEHGMVEAVGIVKLDLAGDASADGIAIEFRRMADADGVHPLLAAEGEGDDVAVGREALAEAIGNRQSALTRAKQDLGGTEGAGGEDHGLGLDGARGRVGLVARRVIDAPMATLLGDMAHGELGEDLGAMSLGVGEISQRHGILGADIAARAAVAAERARRLVDPRRVQIIREAHHDRRRHRGLAKTGARRLQRAIFDEVLGAPVTVRAKHAGRPGEALLQQAIGAHSFRPGGIGEHPGVVFWYRLLE